MKKGQKSKNSKNSKSVKKSRETDSKQKVIIALLILVILVSVFISIKIIVKNNKNNTSETNNSDVIHKEVLKDAKVGNLSITDAMIVVRDGSSTFMAIAKNETDSDYHFNVLYVTFTTGNMTRKIPVRMDATIKANETDTIMLTLDSDISETTKIDYEIE